MDNFLPSFLPSCLLAGPPLAVEDVVWTARRWERGARRAMVSIAISALRHRDRVWAFRVQYKKYIPRESIRTLLPSVPIPTGKIR